MTLNTGKSGFDELIALARKHGEGMPPVEEWNPDNCGEMDMVIRRDGSWWHEGTRITRAPLVKLFASVLRKDTDDETYLVTPVEKIRIKVECAEFLAVRVDIKGAGQDQRLFFTTNMGDVIELGEEHILNVETDEKTLEPTPLLHVRGRLRALLLRPVFYELVEHSVELEIKDGTQLGIYSGGSFFPLGPAGIHNV